ncbi:zonadhesin-like [Diorhabda sublineata]|uniref:zonadhesin-like n=1 Tax=Diorhabda sublineata TaxID=1163346 RepID=UPI0024E12F6E|nr:zonadhesin-like [Diorhabda sublineata]
MRSIAAIFLLTSLVIIEGKQHHPHHPIKATGSLTTPTKPLSTSDSDCPQNEVLNTCASYCEPEATCQNPYPQQKETCIQVCLERCECERGLIRDNSTGTCINRDECGFSDRDRNAYWSAKTPTGIMGTSAIISPELPVCGENEYHNSCASSCVPEPTCQNPNPTSSEMCILICVQRCDCDINNGFIRDEFSGLCVPIENCPSRTVPNSQCPQDEVLNTCASYCVPEATCQNPYPQQYQVVCPKICVERCECGSGLIREDVTGKCIKKDQCSVCNSESQVPGCLSCCNNDDIPTCRNPNPLLACKCLICTPGCVCQDGFVLNEYTGECVRPCDCSVL